MKTSKAFRQGLLITAALALVLTLGAGQTALAAPGGLDPLFGTGGKIITDFGGSTDYAEALVLQPDGKLVAAGATTDGFGLARYNPNGTLDIGFGVGGKATAAFDGIAAAYALVLQPDGKLVTAGYAYNYTVDSYDFALARFNSNGSLDTSFGTGGSGTVTMHFGGGVNVAVALVLQPDGKLVAGGSVYGGVHYDFTLLRYNADGTPDTSFGIGGKVTTDFGTTAYLGALVLQADGKLVAVGEAYVVPANDSDFVLVRYMPDGTLDSGFGAGGKVATDFSGDRDRGSALLLQPDAKLVVAGGGSSFKLARYNSDGSLDPFFGSGGKVTTAFGGSEAWANALVRQPADGMLVASGAAWNGSSYELALVRYNANGSLDTSLGAGGKVIIDFVGFVFDQGGSQCSRSPPIVGRRPFTGETISDTLARVLEREPDWQSLPESTPVRIRDLLRR